MLMARVIGNLVATRKDELLVGRTLLVIQPIDVSARALGRPLVAIDSVGAGVGENVFYVKGREAAHPFLPAEVPTDAAIVGILDHWYVPGLTAETAAPSVGQAKASTAIKTTTGSTTRTGAETGSATRIRTKTTPGPARSKAQRRDRKGS